MQWYATIGNQTGVDRAEGTRIRMRVERGLGEPEQGTRKPHIAPPSDKESVVLIAAVFRAVDQTADLDAALRTINAKNAAGRSGAVHRY